MTSLEDVAKIVWKNCLAVKPTEKALIVSDSKTKKDPRFGISRVLWDVGKNLCKDCALILMKKTGMHGREPSSEVAKAVLDFDVVVAPTKHSITHTKAIANAQKKGARVATMPGITKDMFLRAIPIDYREMDKTCTKLKKLLEKGRNIRVTTRAGTDIYMKMMKGRKVANDNGIINRPGKLNNLPAGEVAIAPKEGSSNGVVVFDLSSLDVRLKKSFKVVVENGFAVNCESKKLWKILTSVENGTNVAELGIGTNPKARITGNILEDEKCLGTAHIAFGTSKDLGGRIQTSVHLDSVFDKPTIEMGGKIIIENGKFRF